MLTTKKQSINTRLAFYAKLADKLDSIGQHIVHILCNFEQQAVTARQLIEQSQIYNSLQFLVTGYENVTKENVTHVDQTAEELSVYEKYLIDKQFRSKRFFIRKILILLTNLLISLLISSICLSPAFRNQFLLILIYFLNSFTQLIGLNNQQHTNYCSLALLSGLQSAFLPSFDCNNCANLTKVAKLSNLDYHQFQAR